LYNRRYPEMLLALLKRLYRSGAPPDGASLTHAARAKACIARREYARAAEELAAAAALEPGNPAWPAAEADCRARAGDLHGAARRLEAALALEPRAAQLWTKLGYARWELALVDEAIDAYRRAVDCVPGTEPAAGNLLFALLHRMESPAQYLVEAKRWARCALPPGAPAAPFANAAEPERRLRVGYVSADFRTHAMSPFIESLLASHDTTRFELVCYDATAQGDKVSARLRGYGAAWRAVGALDDAQFAARVREDRVDLLVDLSGHTAGNRLRAFARRMAPVQVCGHGYPATTGLASFDWRLTDARNDPPGTDAYYTERLYRLPEFCCSYRPAAAAPEPRRPGEPFTFGSLNNVRKLTQRMVTNWGRLLQQVPDARLLVAGTPEGPARERIAQWLAAAGADPQRVQFEGWLPREQYTALHSRIDVALDTYPYNGSTTTFEALFHGVPVVTLSGETLVSRLGRATLELLGDARWVAADDSGYVAVAAGLAARRGTLAAERHGLQQRMRQSLLLDEPGYVARVESAYRDMWRQWCRA
jgi:predicted O-linked N-acetylglucosamine transferase (SPINDLY family)